MTATCIDAFCGAGGLSLGLSQAGFDVRAAFDFNPRAIETYRHNLGAHGFQADASLITGAELKERASVNDLDLFAGGPPRQGFLRRNETPILATNVTDSSCSTCGC